MIAKSGLQSLDPASTGNCKNSFLQNKPNSLGGAYEILPEACENPAQIANTRPLIEGCSK
jgi:hypothetical protein